MCALLVVVAIKLQSFVFVRGYSNGRAVVNGIRQRAQTMTDRD
jgi:hypothetical protein